MIIDIKVLILFKDANTRIGLVLDIDFRIGGREKTILKCYLSSPPEANSLSHQRISQLCVRYVSVFKIFSRGRRYWR
jgi:hypothetical protein